MDAPTVVAPFLCWRCDARLAEAAGPGTDIKCRKCHATNKVPLSAEV